MVEEEDVDDDDGHAGPAGPRHQGAPVVAVAPITSAVTPTTAVLLALWEREVGPYVSSFQQSVKRKRAARTIRGIATR
jgi:hypothetical protein